MASSVNPRRSKFFPVIRRKSQPAEKRPVYTIPFFQRRKGLPGGFIRGGCSFFLDPPLPEGIGEPPCSLAVISSSTLSRGMPI